MKSITTLQVFSMSINTVYIAQLHNRKKSQKISHSKTSHPQYIFLEFLKFLLKLNVSELLYSRIKGYTHKNIQNASVNGLKSPRRSIKFSFRKWEEKWAVSGQAWHSMRKPAVSPVFQPPRRHERIRDRVTCNNNGVSSKSMETEAQKEQITSRFTTDSRDRRVYFICES